MHGHMNRVSRATSGRIGQQTQDSQVLASLLSCLWDAACLAEEGGGCTADTGALDGVYTSLQLPHEENAYQHQAYWI